MEYTEKRPYSLSYNINGGIEAVSLGNGKTFRVGEFIQTKEWETEIIDGFLFIGDTVEAMVGGELKPLGSLRKVFG